MHASRRLGTRGSIALSRWVVCVGLVASASCSSKGGGGAGSGGAGGSTGDGGTGGAAGTRTDAGADVPGVPSNPLCPNGGAIVRGATPLPDGVEIVVADVSGVRDMIVSGAYVYWTTQKTIMRAPVAGGSATMLLDRSAQSSAFVGWLRVDGDTLYFTEVGSYQVARMPADGSAAPTTIARGNSPWQLVVSGGFIYYYEAGLQEIDRVPVAGGTPTPMVRNVEPSDHMVVANGYLYFINPRSNSFDVHLLRVPVNASAPAPGDGGTGSVPAGAEDVVATDNYSTYGVGADATALYWDEDNKVMKAPLAAGATSTALDQLPDHSGDFGLTETTYVGSVAVGSGNLYWNSDLSCGDVFKAASDGGGKTTIVHAVATPSYLTVDATHVYFLAGGRQILRAPR